MSDKVQNIADHKAFACNCGSVNFALLMSCGIECNGCGNRHPFEWLEYDAHECQECGGEGRVTRYSKVTHQLGTDDLPFLEECEKCSGLGWCGPDAEKRAALAKAAT